MSAQLTRDHARARDAADPLAAFEARFEPLPAGVIAYLDGNSLGRPLRATTAVLAGFGALWADRLIRGWDDSWMALPAGVGDELGAAALGAAAGQTVIADSTTVCFYKGLRAALNLRPDRRVLVLDRDHFPTNRYVAESLARDTHREIRWVDHPDAFVPAEDVAVVAFGHVDYRTAELADLRRLTAAAHSCGALTVWDLSHSVGVLPIALDAAEVDCAVGATYKFLGGGPGSPAFVYVSRRHHGRLDQPIWGWLGRQDPFAMGPGYLPAAGIDAMISGTPGVAAILAVRAGVSVVAEAGIEAIRAKSVALTSYVIALADAWLPGLRVASPREESFRGGHVSLAHPDARDLCRRWAASGVLADFREPNLLRLGLSPLSMTFAQCWDALDALRLLV